MAQGLFQDRHGGVMEIGYWLSSEEHTPNDLGKYARQAESVGFTFAQISDHFHPWVDRQGHSPFVWAVSDRRYRACHQTFADPDRCHLSYHTDSSSYYCASICNSRGNDARSLPSGIGNRREPQRAYPGRSLAYH